MTATAPKPKTDATAASLYRLLPASIKSLLKCRCAMRAKLADGSEALLLLVGSGTLKWLMLNVEEGGIRVRLDEVLATKTVRRADGVTTSERLANQLYLMATKAGLS